MKALCENQFTSYIIYLENESDGSSVVEELKNQASDVSYFFGKEYYDHSLHHLFVRYDLPEFFMNLLIVFILMFLNVSFVLRKHTLKQGCLNWVIGYVLALFTLFYFGVVLVWEDFVTYVVILLIAVALVKKKKVN